MEIGHLRRNLPRAFGLDQQRGPASHGHASHDIFPERFDANADRADDSDAGNDDLPAMVVTHTPIRL